VTRARITEVVGRRVWDSRGRPTVEVEVRAGAATGRAIAPAGASRGSGERVDLRDGGSRLGGYDVQAALDGVRTTLAPSLVGRPVGDAASLPELDTVLVELDGTADRSRLGGNALVATSMALAWVSASVAGEPLWFHLGGTTRLPTPEIQIFGGGAHAARRLDLQDLMVVASGASTLEEALVWTAEVYRAAGAGLAERGLLAGVADEGGWWPAFSSNTEGIERLVEAIERAGLRPGPDVTISLDVAASELYRDGRYHLPLDGAVLEADAMAARVLGWLRDYPVVAVEDPLAEHDVAGTALLTALAPRGVLVVADDLTVTDAARVRAAAAAGAANTLLVKPNQAGTLSEAFDARRAAADAGWRAIVSARSGETEDVTICHLAVAWDADLLKVGSITRGERTTKWNELLRIAAELGDAGRFSPPAIGRW
jgi:enolase